MGDVFEVLSKVAGVGSEVLGAGAKVAGSIVGAAANTAMSASQYMSTINISPLLSSKKKEPDVTKSSTPPTTPSQPAQESEEDLTATPLTTSNAKPKKIIPASNKSSLPAASSQSEEVDLPSTPAVNTASQPAAPPPAPKENSNHGLLGALNKVINRHQPKPDVNAWYGDEQITDILRGSVEDKANVVDPATAEVGDGMKTNLAEAAKAAAQGKPTLIPINLDGNHWTGGIMRQGKNGKAQFIYNDSFGNKMPQELQDNFGPDVEIIDLQTKQQNNTNDCGPFAIDNLLKLLGLKDSSTEEMQEELRNSTDSGARLRLNHAEKFPDSFKNSADLAKALRGPLDKEVQKDANEIFSKFGATPNEKDGKKLQCDNPKTAGETANKLKASYEKLGIPCSMVEDENGNFNLQYSMPPKFMKRDPFSMSAEELNEMRTDLKNIENPPEKMPEKEQEKNSNNVPDVKDNWANKFAANTPKKSDNQLGG